MSQQRHHLAEQHLGFTAGVSHRAGAELQRRDLAVVIGTPNVDQVIKPAIEFGLVIGDVGGQI